MVLSEEEEAAVAEAPEDTGEDLMVADLVVGEVATMAALLANVMIVPLLL